MQSSQQNFEQQQGGMLGQTQGAGNTRGAYLSRNRRGIAGSFTGAARGFSSVDPVAQQYANDPSTRTTNSRVLPAVFRPPENQPPLAPGRFRDFSAASMPNFPSAAELRQRNFQRNGGNVYVPYSQRNIQLTPGAAFSQEFVQAREQQRQRVNQFAGAAQAGSTAQGVPQGLEPEALLIQTIQGIPALNALLRADAENFLDFLESHPQFERIAQNPSVLRGLAASLAAEYESGDLEGAVQQQPTRRTQSQSAGGLSRGSAAGASLRSQSAGARGQSQGRSTQGTLGASRREEGGFLTNPRGASFSAAQSGGQGFVDQEPEQGAFTGLASRRRQSDNFGRRQNGSQFGGYDNYASRRQGGGGSRRQAGGYGYGFGQSNGNGYGYSGQQYAGGSRRRNSFSLGGQQGGYGQQYAGGSRRQSGGFGGNNYGVYGGQQYAGGLGARRQANGNGYNQNFGGYNGNFSGADGGFTSTNASTRRRASGYF